MDPTPRLLLVMERSPWGHVELVSSWLEHLEARVDCVLRLGGSVGVGDS